MVYLEKDSFVAKGSNRHLYLHKNFPGKCIKIVLDETKKFLRKNNSYWYKRFFPLSYFGENKKELKYYKNILNKKNTEIFEYIPKMYGTIETNIGEGLLFDYFENTISLKDYIEKFGFDNEIINQMKFFFKIILENNVQLRDQNIYNYLVQNINNTTNEVVMGGGKIKIN
ncbi:MAG: PhoP regulatory network YrbL family protein [Elusimicrobiota bacterium]|nr:PhoP regulatory network YrbL family protein [Elusimicrobiota bacterium]